MIRHFTAGLGARSAATTTTCTSCSRSAGRRSRATAWPACCAPRANTERRLRMFTLTPAAAAADPPGRRRAQRRAGTGAARRRAPGEPTARSSYGMGFDEPSDDDLRLHARRRDRGHRRPAAGRCCEDTVLDFVELEPGAFQLHLHPQTAPRHRAAAPAAGSCGSGGCAGQLRWRRLAVPDPPASPFWNSMNSFVDMPAMIGGLPHGLRQGPPGRRRPGRPGPADAARGAAAGAGRRGGVRPPGRRRACWR